jgi:serine/threonine protein kinase
LDHPNLVPVYEAGEEGPVSFIVSAYCPGITLAEWLKKQTDPVPVQDAAALIATLARAVQHAHERGVLHRDLKPANVLLQMENGEWRMENEGRPASAFSILHSPFSIPKITDFGLAKEMAGDPSDADSPGPTRTGAILGTPCYMAPEQAGGKSKEVTPAADVYALGAILYELLTSRPPFRGETDLDTLLQVRLEDPIPPSRLRPRVPRDLETICLKCLQKEPAKRYRSAAAFAEDLQRFLAGESILARPVGKIERARRWPR